MTDPNSATKEESSVRRRELFPVRTLGIAKLVSSHVDGPPAFYVGPRPEQHATAPMMETTHLATIAR